MSGQDARIEDHHAHWKDVTEQASRNTADKLRALTTQIEANLSSAKSECGKLEKAISAKGQSLGERVDGAYDAIRELSASVDSRAQESDKRLFALNARIDGGESQAAQELLSSKQNREREVTRLESLIGANHSGVMTKIDEQDTSLKRLVDRSEKTLSTALGKVQDEGKETSAQLRRAADVLGDELKAAHTELAAVSTALKERLDVHADSANRAVEELTDKTDLIQKELSDYKAVTGKSLEEVKSGLESKTLSLTEAFARQVDASAEAVAKVQVRVTHDAFHLSHQFSTVMYISQIST
jgi:hypothetical protein